MVGSAMRSSWAKGSGHNRLGEHLVKRAKTLPRTSQECTPVLHPLHVVYPNMALVSEGYARYAPRSDSDDTAEAFQLASDSHRRTMGLNGDQARVHGNSHAEIRYDEEDESDNDEQLAGGDREALAGGVRRMREGFRDTVLDLYAASKIFCIHLITFESLFVVLSSVITTSLYYVFGESARSGTSFGANISWTIVSFAVVSPMIMQIKQAFTRRETALTMIAEMKALMVNILLGNAIWNWGDNGRTKLPSDHVQKSKALLQNVLRDVMALLLLPTFTRGRHRYTTRGRKLALSYVNSVDHLQLRIVRSLRQLHEQVEVMKSCGLPANEASRINQYHWLLQARLEKLQNIKFYRTPQATRSYTRLFILVLPIFYGPYYVYIARGDQYKATNFGFCLMLSVVTSLVMIGIFNVEKAMEDPFAGGGMDGIHVHEMFLMTHQMLDECYNEKSLLSRPVATNVPSNGALQA